MLYQFVIVSIITTLPVLSILLQAFAVEFQPFVIRFLT